MANDIKTLTKNALERDKIFFDEYIKDKKAQRY